MSNVITLSISVDRIFNIGAYWFLSNKMIVNPDKFQAIVVKRNNKMKDSYSLNINPEVINSENCEGIEGREGCLMKYFPHVFWIHVI